MTFGTRLKSGEKIILFHKFFVLNIIKGKQINKRETLGQQTRNNDVAQKIIITFTEVGDNLSSS